MTSALALPGRRLLPTAQAAAGSPPSPPGPPSTGAAAGGPPPPPPGPPHARSDTQDPAGAAQRDSQRHRALGRDDARPTAPDAATPKGVGFRALLDLRRGG
jgi:hypothetical protein